MYVHACVVQYLDMSRMYVRDHSLISHPLPLRIKVVLIVVLI